MHPMNGNRAKNWKEIVTGNCTLDKTYEKKQKKNTLHTIVLFIIDIYTM